MAKSPWLLLLVPLVAGCGGGSAPFQGGAEGYVSAPSSLENRGTETVTGTLARVRMGEDWFRPTVIRAPAGELLTLRLDNDGNLRHAFDVAGDGQHVDVTVPPGGSATVRVRVPTTGRLLFFCKYHWSRGMAGYVEASG